MNSTEPKLGSLGLGLPRNSLLVFTVENAVFVPTSSPLCTSPGDSHIPPWTLHSAPLHWMSPDCCHFTLKNVRPRDPSVLDAMQWSCKWKYDRSKRGLWFMLLHQEPPTYDVRHILPKWDWHILSHLIFTLHSEQGGMTSTLLKLCEVWSLAQGGDRESPAFLSISCTPEWAGLHQFMEVLFLSTSGHHKYFPWPCLAHSRFSTIAFLHNDYVWPAFLQ